MRTWLSLLVIALASCSGSDDAGSTGANGAAGAAGGGGAGGAGGGATDEASVTCQASFDRALACGEQTNGLEAPYLAWCKGFYACTTSALVAEYSTTYWPCANARACGAADDGCVESLGTNRYQNDPAIHQSVDACNARLTECSADGGVNISSDHCAAFALIVPALAAQYQACLAKPCAEIDACFDQARASFGCTDNSPPEVPPSIPDAG